MVGISEAAVSKLASSGVITPGDSALQMLGQYVSRLREQAAGRMGDDGSVDLPRERALLAREQRAGIRIKNLVLLKTYAPIEVLSDVLANASQAVVDRLDQIPAALARSCPGLPPEARAAVLEEIDSARNEMVAKAASIAADALDADDQPVDDAEDPDLADDDDTPP